MFFPRYFVNERTCGDDLNMCQYWRFKKWGWFLVIDKGRDESVSRSRRSAK